MTKRKVSSQSLFAILSQGYAGFFFCQTKDNRKVQRTINEESERVREL